MLANLDAPNYRLFFIADDLTANIEPAMAIDLFQEDSDKSSLEDLRARS